MLDNSRSINFLPPVHSFILSQLIIVLVEYDMWSFFKGRFSRQETSGNKINPHRRRNFYMSCTWCPRRKICPPFFFLKFLQVFCFFFFVLFVFSFVERGYKSAGFLFVDGSILYISFGFWLQGNIQCIQKHMNQQ